MEFLDFIGQLHSVRRESRKEAISYCEQLIENIGVDQVLLRSQVSLELALDLIATRQPQELVRAESLIEQVVSLIPQFIEIIESPTDNLEAYLTYVKGCLALEQGNLAHALDLLSQAHDDCSDNETNQAQMTEKLGQYYLRINNLPTALNYFERALSKRLEQDDELSSGSDYLYLGKIYLLSGDLQQAESVLQIAFDIATGYGDQPLQSQAMHGLAQVAIADSQWQEAIPLLTDAISLRHKPYDSIDIGYLYCDLAEAYLGDRQIVKSRECLEHEAIPIFNEFSCTKGMAIAKYILAKIQVQELLSETMSPEEDKLQSLEHNFHDVSTELEQLGLAFDYVKSLHSLAELYYGLLKIGQGYYQYKGKALRSLEICLDLLEKLGLGNLPITLKTNNMLDQIIHLNV